MPTVLKKFATKILNVSYAKNKKESTADENA